MKGKRSIRRFLCVPERGLNGLNYVVSEEIKKITINGFKIYFGKPIHRSGD